MRRNKALVPRARIQGLRSVVWVRGPRVMIDADLADLYGVPTKALNQAVKRNRERLPADFRFKLNTREKKQVVTACDHLARLRFSRTLPSAVRRLLAETEKPRRRIGFGNG